MVLPSGKLPHRPTQMKFSFLSVIITIALVILVSTAIGFLDLLQVFPRNSSPTSPPSSRCPVIVYNKQIKTGSTVIANVLYRTTEAYGCYNAGCKFHQLLMNGNTSHIGARNGATLTCHAQERNKNIIPNLRATHGKDFAYIASIREPIGWFKSAACFFYRQNVNSSVEWTDEGYKKVIDWFLKPEEYEPRESYLFLSLGLYPGDTKRQVMDKLLQYDLIIDNAKMSEGLEELGKLLRWKMLKPSHAKPVTYRGPLYYTYRADQIKKRTLRVAMLYGAATEIRNAKYKRPAFAVEKVPELSDE